MQHASRDHSKKLQKPSIQAADQIQDLVPSQVNEISRHKPVICASRCPKYLRQHMRVIRSTGSYFTYDDGIFGDLCSHCMSMETEVDPGSKNGHTESGRIDRA